MGKLYATKETKYAIDVNILQPFCLYLAEPHKPRLDTNNPDPTDGDSITLTCTSTTPEATTYVFEKDDTVVFEQSTNTYTINPATIGANDGVYKCYFYIGTIKAESSPAQKITCEFIHAYKPYLIMYQYILCKPLDYDCILLTPLTYKLLHFSPSETEDSSVDSISS